MNDWYLIQFKTNSHYLAERNLKRQGFETFLPMQRITSRKSSRFVSDLKPLFPGYMFVKANTELAPWRKINSTIGVSRLVTFQGRPKSLPILLVPGLMQRCDASSVLLPPKNIRQGDIVEILTGPLSNFIATVDTIDPTQRIWILINFMGQKTRMQVTSDKLQLAR